MNNVEPTNSSLGGAPGIAFLIFKAWILFREPGKYRTTFSGNPYYAAGVLETQKAQVKERG